MWQNLKTLNAFNSTTSRLLDPNSCTASQMRRHTISVPFQRKPVFVHVWFYKHLYTFILQTLCGADAAHRMRLKSCRILQNYICVSN